MKSKIVECHLKFIESFFNKTLDVSILEYEFHQEKLFIINNNIYFENKGVKLPIIIRDGINWVMFESNVMRVFKKLIIYLIELNIDFYYLTYKIAHYYPNIFMYENYQLKDYFIDIYSNIYIYSDMYNDNTTLKHIFNHHVSYGNREKMLKYFESIGYDCMSPIYKFINNEKCIDEFANFANFYFKRENAQRHIGDIKENIRAEKLKILLA